MPIKLGNILKGLAHEQRGYFSKKQEGKRGKADELEVAALGAASRVGMYVGGVLCIILVIVSRWLLGRGDIALTGWMIYMAMAGASNLVLYKRLKRKEKLAAGIICMLSAVVFMAAFAAAIHQYKAGM